MNSAEQEKVVWKHIEPGDQAARFPAGADEVGVLSQAELAVLLAHALGRLEGEHGADAAFAHDFGLCGQAAGQRIGRLGAVVDGRHAAAQHLEQDGIGRRADQFVVEAIFHQRPPEILQEGPEAGGRLVERQAVRQQPVEMRVRVDKAGRERAAGRVDHLVVRKAAAQFVVGRDRVDHVASHAHAPVASRRLAGGVDQEVR